MKQGVFHSIIVISSEIVAVIFTLRILHHLVTFDVTGAWHFGGTQWEKSSLRDLLSA